MGDLMLITAPNPIFRHPFTMCSKCCFSSTLCALRAFTSWCGRRFFAVDVELISNALLLVGLQLEQGVYHSPIAFRKEFPFRNF